MIAKYLFNLSVKGTLNGTKVCGMYRKKIR